MSPSFNLVSLLISTFLSSSQKVTSLNGRVESATIPAAKKADLKAKVSMLQGIAVMVFSTDETANKALVCAGVPEKGDKCKQLKVFEWLVVALKPLKGKGGGGKGGLAQGQGSDIAHVEDAMEVATSFVNINENSNESWVSETMVAGTDRGVEKLNGGESERMEDSLLLRESRKNEESRPSINIEVALVGAQREEFVSGPGNRDSAQAHVGLAQPQTNLIRSQAQINEEGQCPAGGGHYPTPDKPD
ncbi:Alanine--tRNA ligase [Camellia lanceoleosa]|uniref:Alanine--tRNA ligase n=1 Tax=Camellia lanceoleosa TaxID=1840588 RepID=A0ACC0FBQ1_9ERIC|nr:Alanine--tRNA ligase [Camellia lanceoleosa]